MSEDKLISEQFVRDLTRCQEWLYAYILSLLPDANAARDVLQQTNVALWRKSTEYIEGTNFDGWACRIAYFEVLSARRNYRRDLHVFDDELLSELSNEAQSQIFSTDGEMLALEHCLDRLSIKQRELLYQRYTAGLSVKRISEEVGCKAGAIATTLHRIRRSLMECIRIRLDARNQT